MKIYYGNTSGNRYEPGKMPPIGLLDAYVDFKKGPKRPVDWCDSYFMDSGAFSAWKSGRPVVLKEYMDYLTTHMAQIDFYASLDVIGNPQASWDNWCIMQDAGFNAMPAYHLGEPIEWLHKMVEAGADYIGLGGIASADKKTRFQFLNQCFKHYPDSTKIGFHGFGVTDRQMLLDYPWRTVDSRQAHLLARFGAIDSPWGAVTINPDCDPRGQQWRTPDAVAKIRNWIEAGGFDWELACTSTVLGKFERTRITIIYMEEVAKATPIRYKPHHNHLF